MPLLRFTNKLSLFIARRSFKCSVVSNVTSFRHRCLWIKESRRGQIDQYHQQLPGYEAETYAKQSSKAMRQFQKKYTAKQAARQAIPASFPAPIENPESFQNKKGGSRRKRGLTARETADLVDRDARQRLHATVRKAERTQMYNKLMLKEVSQRSAEKKRKKMSTDEDGFSHLSD